MKHTLILDDSVDMHLPLSLREIRAHQLRSLLNLPNPIFRHLLLFREAQQFLQSDSSGNICHWAKTSNRKVHLVILQCSSLETNCIRAPCATLWLRIAWLALHLFPRLILRGQQPLCHNFVNIPCMISYLQGVLLHARMTILLSQFLSLLAGQHHLDFPLLSQ